MKTIASISIAILLGLFASCKKGYTCSCSSNDGFYDGFDIHGSKRNAEKKCENYYKSKYQTPPASADSIPASPVQCELLKGE
ncbi:MAG: hypothetical protein V4580_12105 [Bacteroidota bacterium]